MMDSTSCLHVVAIPILEPKLHGIMPTETYLARLLDEPSWALFREEPLTLDLN